MGILPAYLGNRRRDCEIAGIARAPRRSPQPSAVVETEAKAAADRLDLAIRPRRNRRTEWAPRLVRELD